MRARLATMKRRQRTRISGLIGVDDRTIRKWLGGERVHATHAWALEQACGQLGIPVPKRLQTTAAPPSEPTQVEA